MTISSSVFQKIDIALSSSGSGGLSHFHSLNTYSCYLIIFFFIFFFFVFSDTCYQL
jgi:hypothetical protein